MMKPRKKEYIRNCTGADCENENLQKRRIFSRIIFYILLLAFLGTLFYIILFSNYLQITNINIQGNSELKGADLQQTLQNTLQGKYLRIIPKNNFLFVFSKRDENILQNDFKKIKSISIAKKFPDTLNVTVEEYSSLLVWCAGSQCYMIDADGVAYSQADFNSPEITQNHLVRINDTSGQGVSLGDQVVDPAYASYVLGLKDALSPSGITLTDDGFQTPSRMAEEIDVQTTNGFQLLFSTQFPQDEAINTLNLVLQKQVPQNQQSNLAYVDLRSEGRAFYKMNGDVSATDSSTVQPTDSLSDQTASRQDKKKK